MTFYIIINKNSLKNRPLEEIIAINNININVNEN